MLLSSKKRKKNVLFSQNFISFNRHASALNKAPRNRVMVRVSKGKKKYRDVIMKAPDEIPNPTWTWCPPLWSSFIASFRQPFPAKWRDVIAMKAFGQSEDWIWAQLRIWWPLYLPVLLDYMRRLFCWSAGLLIHSPAQELSQVRDIPSRSGLFSKQAIIDVSSCQLCIVAHWVHASTAVT